MEQQHFMDNGMEEHIDEVERTGVFDPHNYAVDLTNVDSSDEFEQKYEEQDQLDYDLLRKPEDDLKNLDSSDEGQGTYDEQDQLDYDLLGETEENFVDVKTCLVGCTKSTMEDIYELYRNHAREIGFSVRKSTQRTNGDKLILEKYFICSSAGSKQQKSNSPTTKKKKIFHVTRTGCKAALRAKINTAGVYEVVSHNTIHNHELTRKAWGHLHRSERVITSEKASAIEDMISSGMRPSDSYRYMVQAAGGEPCVGHTMKDQLNFVNRFRRNAIEGGDAQTLIDMLHQKNAKEPGFFLSVKLDNGRLCNIFWRDSMMKDDYQIFGDVVVFDTTYRTNRYNLICAPFVGINNHWKNIMFGCAFIADEKIESFVWLFEAFKSSMDGKCPESLFTDQDLAIGSAIEKVFPDTKHRLCLWHLYQNAVSRFGNLKSNKDFNKLFNKCLSGCNDLVEFDECWNSMITSHGLEDNSWFKRLYDLRNRWSTALNKDYFSAGILSSQRSESTNNAIGFRAKKTTSLNEFYVIFNETVKRWRANEVNDEFQCARASPNSVIPLTGLVKHAAEVYTLKLFKDFEEQLLKCIATSSIVLNCQNDKILYSVSDHEVGYSQTVEYYPSNTFITCSCKRFEECGLLCMHCLRVFHLNSVSEIPDAYIKKRWTKMAKRDIWDRLEITNEQHIKPKDCLPWRHKMGRNFYNIVLKSEENDEVRKFVDAEYNRFLLAVEGMMAYNSGTTEEHVSHSSIKILDPTRSITKGRKQRIKGHFERKKKGTGIKNSKITKEVGSIIQNPRLF